MRDRLAYLVTTRRRQLGLSVAKAARQAGIARSTWIDLERSRRTTAPHLHAAIEATLAWQHGSLNAVLEGGDPTNAPPAETSGCVDPATGEAYTGDERLLWLLPLPEGEKRKLIYHLRAERIAQQTA